MNKSSFWEKIFEENISIYWNNKKENLWKITNIFYFNIKEKIEHLVKNENELESLFLVLKEILANSVDSIIDLKWILNSLKTKTIKIKIFNVKNKELIFIIKDNWTWEESKWTEDKTNNDKYFWWLWIWEKTIKKLQNVIKYKRISKKSWTVVFLKIKI